MQCPAFEHYKNIVHHSYSVAKTTDPLIQDTWRIFLRFLMILMEIKLSKTIQMYSLPLRIQSGKSSIKATDLLAEDY